MKQDKQTDRGHWNSRLGFVFAAAGSAIGLGNIWKFPYITGMNGGGWFVLIYLGCILFVGLPVMIGELMIGRATQESPTTAIRLLSRRGSPWVGLGWAGVACAFLMLSFYSVVAGWTLHYMSISALGAFNQADSNAVTNFFNQDVVTNSNVNLAWHGVFMFLTLMIVIGGVQRGIELATKIMMPLLLLMMGAMLVMAFRLDGFNDALQFVFGTSPEHPITWAGVLEALGHAFFTLSIGMGAMITYGSYLRKDDDIVTTAGIVSGLDTLIALVACLIIFPITFTAKMEPGAGPGLVFQTVPLALEGIPGGAIWTFVFFTLLFFAALSSSISLLEVVVSYFVDDWRVNRWAATLFCGAAVFVAGIPSALSDSTEMFGVSFANLNEGVFTALGQKEGKNWFNTIDYLVSNIMLPMGGLFLAVFVSWFVASKVRKEEFQRGTMFGFLYYPWLFIMKIFVPIAVFFVFLKMLGIIDMLMPGDA